MTSGTKLHEDLPLFDAAIGKWYQPTPLDDLQYAIETFPQWTAEPAPWSQRIEPPLTMADVAEVERYRFRYGGMVWTPSNDAGGTELEMAVLARLNDGRYMSVLAWNDYTGWGCQDDATVKVGTRDQVIAQGLDNESRAHLGLTISEPGVGS